MLLLAVGEVRRSLAGLRAQRREVAVQALDRQLVDAHRPVEVLQLMRPEVVEVEVALVVLEQRPGRLREQDLAAVAGVADPGGAMHGQPDVVIACGRRLAGVHADPHAHGRVLRPRVRRQGALRRHRRVDGVPGAAKRDEERVALVVELPPAVGLPGVPEQAPVVLEDGAVVVPQLAQQRRRAVDVGEEEGECGGCALVQAHVTGSVARSRKPPPACGPASSSPPYTDTRSRIPTSPCPLPPPSPSPGRRR